MRAPYLRTALIVGALAIGLFGAFGPQAKKAVAPALACFGASAALLVAAVGVERREPLPEPVPGERRRPRWAPWVALGGAAGAVALELVALPLFESRDPVQGRAWALHVAALVLLAGAFWPWRGAFGATGLNGATPSKFPASPSKFPASPSGLPASPSGPRFTRRELAALAGVLALAAFFRFHHLATLPYGAWFDEAQNTLEARAILEHPEYRPVFVSGYSQMPALSFYYFAPFVAAFPQKVLGVRVATSVAGLLAVLLVSLLGRELWGPRAGLLAGALLAVSRWHVDFSRFGMAIVLPTLFVPLALLLFLRALRRQSPREGVLAGLALGLGMQTYYAMFAIAPLLVLVFLHRALAGRPRSLAAGGILALTLGAAALAYAPVAQYARKHEGAFAERMRTVSMVPVSSLRELAETLLRPSPRRGPALETLRKNVVAHARMFHFDGDRNGRHNLPGAPMLDPVSGLLFALGLGLCLASILEPRAAMLLLWFAALLAPGVLSLPFEAPQGARACGVTAAVALLGALPLARAWELLDGASRLRRWAANGLVAALLALAAVHCYRTFFGRQLREPAVATAFSPEVTRVGEIVRDEGPSADVYVPEDVNGLPSQVVIAGYRPARSFDRSRDLPLPFGSGQAVVVLHAFDADAREQLRSTYPGASLEDFEVPVAGGPGPRLLTIVRVPREELERSRGFRTTLTAAGREPVRVRSLTASWSWAEQAPEPPFEALVEGVLGVADERLDLELVSDHPATLTLDGETLLERPGRARLSLATGSHRLAMRVDVRKRSGRTELRWAPGGGPASEIPGSSLFAPELPSGGLEGRYYQRDSCEGQHALRRIDPQLAFYFHNPPVRQPFSACWSGSVYAPVAGTYELGAGSIDASRVVVDGAVVAENAGSHEVVWGRLANLEAGWHDLDVSYRGASNYAQIYLWWRAPGGDREVVPSGRLAAPLPSGWRLPRGAPGR